jgi:hypothetical protein
LTIVFVLPNIPAKATFDKFLFGCFSKDFSLGDSRAQFVPPSIHHGQITLLNG